MRLVLASIVLVFFTSAQNALCTLPGVFESTLEYELPTRPFQHIEFGNRVAICNDDEKLSEQNQALQLQ